MALSPPLLSKLTSGTQPLRQGHSHPPSTNDGGTSTLTTTLPATSAQATNHCSLSPTLPCPVSYVGAVLSTIGGDCQPLLQVLQATTAHKSAAVTLHRTARQHKRPRCCPGRCNVPWAPNPPDEATPSHPQPTMGGLQHQLCPMSRRCERTIGLLGCIYLPPSNPSPSKVPLQLTRGGFNDSFRDNGVIPPPRKCLQ